MSLRKGTEHFFNSLSRGLIDTLAGKKGDALLNIVEFQTLSDSFSRVTSELQDMAKRTAIVSISRKVAHDLRSPVNVIEMCLKDTPSDKTNILLKNAAHRISEISSLLLDKSRYSLLPNRTRFEVHSLIQQLIEDKKIEYSDFDLCISLVHEQPLLDLIWVNKTDLYRVLSNLINNAIEAQGSNQKKEIKIELQKTVSSFIITISDSGSGFSDEIIKNFKDKKVVSTKVLGNSIGLNSAVEFMNKCGELEIFNNTSGGGSVSLFFNELSLIRNDTPIIHIDDDRYIRHSWKTESEKKGIALLSHESSASLLKNIEEADLLSEFYIDLNLDNGESGKELAAKLHGLGFTRLNFSTGELLDISEVPSFINSLVDKKYPY